MIRVNVPGLGPLSFPDGTPESVMRDAIDRELARRKSVDAPPRPQLPWEDPDNPLRQVGLPNAQAGEVLDLPTGPHRSVMGDIADLGSPLRSAMGLRDALTKPPGRTDNDPNLYGSIVRRAADAAGGWGIGLAERAGLVEPGTRQEMLGNLRQEEETVMAGGDPLTRGAALYGADLYGGTAGTAAPGMSIGRGVAALGAKVPALAGSAAGRVAIGAGAAGLEGALQGAGDTAGAELPQQGLGIALSGGLAALAGGAGASGANRALVRIDALKKRVDDVARGVAAPPPERVGAAAWGAYNQERAAIDTQVDAIVQQQTAVTGQPPPPESISAMRKAQVTALNERMHAQTSAQAAVSTEPAIHSLADQVEQPVAFIEAPELPMADLLELQQASLKIAAPELRPDRSYRNVPLHSDNPNARVYVYKDPVSGEDVGYLLAHPEPNGGFKVKNVFVEESHRGGGIPEHLYDQAYTDLGPYKGSTDYASRRTKAGNGMHDRLQRTVPHVFTDTGDSVVPTESLIRDTDPHKTIRQRLRDANNRFIETMSDKKEPIMRTLREAGLDERAREIELWLSQARGAARVAANTVWKGVRHWDAETGNVTRSYDSLHSIIGNLGKKGWRDLNDFMAAERHMSLLARKQDADAKYAGELAARRAEIEARRQEVLGARKDVRRATKEGRESLARQLRATRNESKAAAQMDVRASVADVAARRSDKAQSKVGTAAYGRTARENATLAESAATRLADASSFKANQAAIGDVLGDLAGTSKTVESAVTRRYQKLPPRAQRPPDSLLKIDPRGTKWAQAKLTELGQRYQPDPATGVSQLSDIARRVREWSWQAVVEQLDQVGYFTPEAKAALAAQRDVFAPYARLADDVEADLGLVTGTQSKPLERIHGGLSPDKPIAEPLESFVAQTQRIALWVERQRVFNQLGDAAEAFPAELGDTIKRLPPNSKNGFQVFRDGVRHVYSAPDDVMRALSRTDPAQTSFLVQAGVLAARMLRAGVTLSPDFAVRNFQRDQSTAGVYGAEFKFRPFSDFLVGLWAQTPFASPELHKMVFDWESAGGALGDIISVERPKATYTGKAAAGLAEFNLPGGKTFSIESPRVARHLAEWRAEGYLGRVVYPFLNPLEAAASSIEQATRIGAYRRAKVSGGVNDLAASWFSRNITLDFGRSGSFAQRWNSVEAFANASLQDVARFSRAMHDRPFATTIAALSYITLPSLAAYALNRDNPDYQSRPEWEKASFYHLFQRKDKTWVMFPRPLGMINLSFGYGIEKMLNAVGSKYDEPVTQLLSTIFQETPLRYLPLQPDTDPNSVARGSWEFLPTALQPMLEAGAGEEGWSEFRKSPLVPRALIELLPADRYTDTTSALARKVGEMTGATPLKVDHLIRNYMGTLGVQALRLAERAAGAEELPQLPTTANDIPVVGAFVSGNPYGFSTQPAQDFYALEEAAREASNSLTKAAESKDTARYHRILRENPEALIADVLYDIRAGQKKDGPPSLAQLRQMRNEYRTVPGLTPELRAERILQTDMMISQTVISTMHWVAKWRQQHLAAAAKRDTGAQP